MLWHFELTNSQQSDVKNNDNLLQTPETTRKPYSAQQREYPPKRLLQGGWEGWREQSAASVEAAHATQTLQRLAKVATQTLQPGASVATGEKRCGASGSNAWRGERGKGGKRATFRVLSPSGKGPIPQD